MKFQHELGSSNDLSEYLREEIDVDYFEGNPPVAIKVWRCDDCAISGWIVYCDAVISSDGGADDQEFAGTMHENRSMGCDGQPCLLEGFEGG